MSQPARVLPHLQAPPEPGIGFRIQESMERPDTPLRGGRGGFPEEAPKLRGAGGGEEGPGQPSRQRHTCPCKDSLQSRNLWVPIQGWPSHPRVSRLERVQESAGTFPGWLPWVLRGPHLAMACCQEPPLHGGGPKTASWADQGCTRPWERAFTGQPLSPPDGHTVLGRSRIEPEKARGAGPGTCTGALPSAHRALQR